MEFTRLYLPMEWEERWRREKERRKQVIEERGEEFEEENRRLEWIRAYNDRRMGMEGKGKLENVREESGKGDKKEEVDKKQETQSYHKDTHPGEIFEALDELRQCRLLTDLTLTVEDGHSFQAHAIILAAVSSVVQQKLQERNCEKQTEIHLKLDSGVSGLGFSAVVEFAYTGAISCLNRQVLPQIKAAAICLGVPRVLDLCEVEGREPKRGGIEKMEGKGKISAEEQLEVSLHSIMQLWEDRVGCDVELEVEDQTFYDALSQLPSHHNLALVKDAQILMFAHKLQGQNIHSLPNVSHSLLSTIITRVILAASSDFFRAMFSSGMRESQQASVPLLLVGAAELEDLIHCCYSGDLLFNWGCIFELTRTALQFQIQPALSICLSFLEWQMDIHSCLDVVAFAEAYMIGDLLQAAEDFVLRHFQEIVATPKFQDMSAEKLLDLLQDDGLCAPSELAVFRAVVAWIEAEPTDRLPRAREVLSGVRFPLMTFREFREVRAVNLHMECCGDSVAELYGSALKEFGLKGFRSEVQHRIRHPRDALVLVGGDQLDPDNGQRLPSRQLWFINSLRSGIGLVKEMEWRFLGEMPEQARFRHGIAVLNGKLYVAGGCHFYTTADTMKSAYRYDPLKNSWKKLADMHEPRSNFILVVRGDSLFAIGGDRTLNTNLDSVERFSPDTETWSFAHPLDQPLSGHAATVWKGEIFISGGFNCKYQCLVSMLLYHPEHGTTYLSDMAHDRAQHCMESLDNCFYIAGGMSKLRKFYGDQLSCECYNPISDCWTEITPLPLSHVGAASAVLEEKLYILGGYCQEDYSESRLVHRYDPTTQRWESMGKIIGPVTDVRACLLRLPAELRK